MAATIADMYTEASDAPQAICDPESGRYGERRDRAPRICFLGMATSVISVFIALTLIQMEMLIGFFAPGLVSSTDACK